MPAMAQLNVRMSPERKAAGDSVLDLYGVLPSQLVRAVWDKTSHGEEAFRQLVEALVAEPAAGSGRTAGQTEMRRAIDEFEQKRERYMREMGFDMSKAPNLTREELRELAYQERAERWGEHYDI